MRKIAIATTIITLFIVVIGSVSTVSGGSLRATFQKMTHPTESRLAFFGEPRINSLIEEFKRRSPALVMAHTRFIECMRAEDVSGIICEVSVHIRSRDDIISREWPHIYDRLMVSGDWGAENISVLNHEDFLAEIRGYTPNKIRNDYLPVIHYRRGQLVFERCNQTDTRRFVPRDKILSGLCV